MKLTGAEIIIECLKEQSVDTVFGFPGGAVLNIYDALYKHSAEIRHILTAHEQGACHAADGYARSTGKTGVVIATSGPGATNLVTGIATAYMDSVPLVAITGNVSTDLLGLDSFQEIDITGVTMPITKHNYIVRKVEDLAPTIREAFAIASEGRKGPVLIDVPKDITAAVTQFQPQQPRERIFPCSYTERELEEVCLQFEQAKAPMIYTGGGVISSGAAEELDRFAELLDAPVASSLMGQGGFDKTSPRYIGMLGMHGTVTSSKAIGKCDLFVGIGTRFSDRVIGDIKSFAPHATLVHIDIDPAEINKNIKVHYQLTGDIKTILSAVNKRLSQQTHTEWLAKIQEYLQRYPLTQLARGGKPTPQQIIETLWELTDGDAIITTEVGQHQMWAAQFYNFRRPRQFITSGGLGTMGYGLGASLGAQLANPEKQVVNIAGDGSFHMNCNELVTAYKFNIPIIELLFNNNVLGMVRQWQRLFYDARFSQTTLDRNTDYMKLAEAYHIKGLQIKTPEDIIPVLTEALNYNGPILVECLIDPDVNVLPMIPAGAPLDKPILDLEIK